MSTETTTPTVAVGEPPVPSTTVAVIPNVGYAPAIPALSASLILALGLSAFISARRRRA